MASLLSPENYKRFKESMLNVSSQLRNSDPAALAAFAAGKLPLDKLPGYAKIIEEFLPFVNKDALRKYTTDKIPEQYMNYRNDKSSKAEANKEASKKANKNTIVE